MAGVRLVADRLWTSHCNRIADRRGTGEPAAARGVGAGRDQPGRRRHILAPESGPHSTPRRRTGNAGTGAGARVDAGRSLAERVRWGRHGGPRRHRARNPAVAKALMIVRLFRSPYFVPSESESNT